MHNKHFVQEHTLLCVPSIVSFSCVMQKLLDTMNSNCWPDCNVDPSVVAGHLDFTTFYQFLLLPGFSFYCLLHVSASVKAIIRKFTI